MCVCVCTGMNCFGWDAPGHHDSKVAGQAVAVSLTLTIRGREQ